MQLHLYIACPHFLLCLPIPPEKTVNTIHTIAPTNPESKISSSHRENGPHPGVPLAMGHELQPFCRLQSLPALDQHVKLLVAISTWWANAQIRASWRGAAGMEEPRLASPMCRPCLWAIIFPSLKMSSVLQAAKYKHMSINTDNTISICPLLDKARSPGGYLFLYKMGIHYHVY